MKPIELTSDNFDSTINEASVPVLVDFHATWCGPCKMLTPVVEQVAAEKGDDALVAKVDIDAARDIAQRYRITSVPTLMVFVNGEPVKTARGVQGKSSIESMIDEASQRSAGV